MPVLETQSLTRCYGPLKAVDSLSLSVEAGEVFGLLGPNGAGKTTVIKMLCTLLPPTSGTARVAGYDICKQPVEVRHSIGLVPQMLSADGSLTGYENLLVFAKLYEVPRQQRERRVKDALDFMGLNEAANKLVREYSGGMIRRLEIAQSMMHRPRMLFLDEPTVGLDPLARNSVWERIEQLRTEYGTTILLTTHLMEEADNLCHRIAIMDHGKVVVIGSPQELKASIEGAAGREPETGAEPEEVTLDDVFIYYTGGKLDERGGGYRETARARRTAHRLG
jgi:ABC-2 type transport system ATP-binding protein